MADSVTSVAKDAPKEGGGQPSSRRRARRVEQPPLRLDEAERRAELAKAQPDVGTRIHTTI